MTETYSGGQFDYLPSPVEPSIVPLIRGDPQEKYLSLGPNIYGLVKTFYATYTYLTTNPLGLSDQSLEVITQVSTKIFSTTRLPDSISLAAAAIVPTAALQLDKDSLLTIKESHASEQGHATPDITASYTQLEENGPAVPQTQQDGLSSQASTDSYLSTLENTTPVSSVYQPDIQGDLQGDIDVPANPQPITRPTENPQTAQLSPTKPIPTAEPDNGQNAESTVSDSEDESSDDGEGSSLFANGLFGAVVGGISNALIPKPQDGGVNVNLGPVLDAVATLLRGPIRSAIANRRTAGANDRTDAPVVSPTPVLQIPKFARIPSESPNFIPVGGAANNNRYVSPSRSPGYGFIPLSGRNTQQILPRIDTSSEIEANDNALGNDNIPQQIPTTRDRYITQDVSRINHANDPHIIDVLNKYEHSYLYNKPVKDPLKIKIVPGGEQNRPASNHKKPSHYRNKSKVQGSNTKPNPLYKRPPPQNQNKHTNVNHGQAGNGQSNQGQFGNGQRNHGKPGNGQHNHGQPGNGQHNHGQPGNGQHNHGQPGNGQRNHGQPGNGQRNQGQPGIGQRNHGQPGNGQPARGQAHGNHQGNHGQGHLTNNGQSQINYNANANQRQPPRGQSNPNYSQGQPTRGQTNQGQSTRGQVNSPYNQGQPTRGQASPTYNNNNSQVQPTRVQTSPSFSKPKISGQSQKDQIYPPFNQGQPKNDGQGQRQRGQTNAAYNQPKNQGQPTKQTSNQPFSAQGQNNPNYRQSEFPSGGQKTQYNGQTPSIPTQGGPPYGLQNSNANKTPKGKFEVVPGGPPPGSYAPSQQYSPALQPTQQSIPNNEYVDYTKRKEGGVPGDSANVRTQDSRNQQYGSNPADSNASVSEPNNVVTSVYQGQTGFTTNTDSPAYVNEPAPSYATNQGKSETPTKNGVYKKPTTNFDSKKDVSTLNKPILPYENSYNEPITEGYSRVSTSSSSSYTGGQYGNKVDNNEGYLSGTNPTPKIVSATGGGYPTTSRSSIYNDNRYYDNVVTTSKSSGAGNYNSGRRSTLGSSVTTPSTNYYDNVKQNNVDNRRTPFVRRPTPQPQYGDKPATKSSIYIGGNRRRTTQKPTNDNNRRRNNSPNTLSQQQSSSQYGGKINYGGDEKKTRPSEVQIDVPTYGVPSSGDQGSFGTSGLYNTENNKPVRPTLNPYEDPAYGEIEPSFTVTANFPISSPSSTPSYSVKNSGKRYDFEGWLTDGDPLKNLPPLRPTTARQTLDITAVQTEAPKTVTYANEWQTHSDIPSVSFTPQNPPPPASNFEREWTTYQKGGKNTKVPVLKPTKVIDISVTETDAPKTVTYANEWFANTIDPARIDPSKIVPTKTKVYTNYQYVHETRHPGKGNARIDIVNPYDDLPYPTTNQAETNDNQSGDNPYEYPEQTKPYEVSKETPPYQATNKDNPEPTSPYDGATGPNTFVTPKQSNRARKPTQPPNYNQRTTGRTRTSPSYTRITRKPLLDFSGPGSNRVSYFGGVTTPGILSGKAPAQIYDPYLSYPDYPEQTNDRFGEKSAQGDQENSGAPSDKSGANVGGGVTTSPNYVDVITARTPLEQQDVFNIKVTVDGYSGFKERL